MFKSKFIYMHGIEWDCKSLEQEEYIASLGLGHSLVIRVDSEAVWNAIENDGHFNTVVETIGELTCVPVAKYEGWYQIYDSVDVDITIHE